MPQTLARILQRYEPNPRIDEAKRSAELLVEQLEGAARLIREQARVARDAM